MTRSVCIRGEIGYANRNCVTPSYALFLPEHETTEFTRRSVVLFPFMVTF